ncbi:MAG: hypothetical protein ABIJ56_23250 [Pseudomonadota bacterium]
MRAITKTSVAAFLPVMLVLVVLPQVSCDGSGEISGPAVEFVIHYEPAVIETIASFTVYITASDFSTPNQKFCDPGEGFTYLPRELDGKSFAIHQGRKFSNEAALRIEGHDADHALLITRQGMSSFPDSGVSVVNVDLQATCLNIIDCPDREEVPTGNYDSQCDRGQCTTNATPAAGIFKDDGPIETGELCVPEEE